MVGGAALLADGMITPPISVISAIEGLQNIKSLGHIGVWTIVGIAIGIMTVLFFSQQFGTSSIGKLFGPIMTIWFLMLAVLGLTHLGEDWNILRAFNPYFAINFLVKYPVASGCSARSFSALREPRRCTLILVMPAGGISGFRGRW